MDSSGMQPPQEVNDPAIADLRFLPAMDRVHTVTAVSVASLGMLVLIGGWALGIEPLKGIAPGFPTMKANTAIGFIFAGLSLWLWRNPVSWAHRSAEILGVFVALLGMVNSVQYSSGANFGIDELFFLDPDSPFTSHPGRMSFNTSLSFLFVGASLALLPAAAAEWFVLIALLPVLLSGAGYLYGTDRFIGSLSFTGMAMNTTILFLLLAAGILASRPRRGLMLLLVSSGPEGTVTRWLFPAGLAVLVILAALTQWGFLEGCYGPESRNVLNLFGGCLAIFWLIFAVARMMARMDSERKRMEGTIIHHMHHDLLTGLPNRMLFMDRLVLSLAQARRSGRKAAVLSLDIDRFKAINDALGHAGADLVLKEVAARLRECVRESDTLARTGGDSFAGLLPEISHAEDAAKIAEKAMACLKGPCVVKGNELHVSACIGISIYPDDAENAEEMFKNADTALHYAKVQGRGSYQFFNDSLTARSLERILLENSLRRTLEMGELVLHYQPQVNLSTGRIVYAEALVRWRHPELGLLNPLEFLPLAEEIGFIVPIDEWVLRTACIQNKAWQDAGYSPLCVTVNLSARQFRHPRLPELIARILHETGLSSRWLELEITETIVMEDVEVTIPLLTRLVDMGIRFSIDDFGTGYSSLSYLKKFPVHKLKIDKSFIRGLPDDPDDGSIVTAVIALAHNMNLDVVAEGVETEEQLAFLRSGQCDSVQGFLFSEPLPPEELGELLLSQS